MKIIFLECQYYVQINFYNIRLILNIQICRWQHKKWHGFLKNRSVKTPLLEWIFSGFHRYHENARRLSRIYRDQPHTPLEQAVYWTEYVIRHKGAPHLRSAVLDLAWYQYFLLDVLAVLALVVASVVLIVYMTLRAVLGKICGGGRHKEDDKTLRKKKRD